MKIVVIVIVAVVVLAGGGGAAWFLFLKEPSGEAEPAPPPVPVTVFLEVDSINVPVIRGGAIEKYVLLKVTLELSDEPAKVEATQALPKLRDLYLTTLYEYFANVSPTNQDRVNLRAVKARLQRASDDVLGEGKVTAVLVQGAFERDWKPTN